MQTNCPSRLFRELLEGYRITNATLRTYREHSHAQMFTCPKCSLLKLCYLSPQISKGILDHAQELKHAPDFNPEFLTYKKDRKKQVFSLIVGDREKQRDKEQLINWYNKLKEMVKE